MISPTSVRLSAEVLAGIDAVAAKERRSRSQTIEILLEEALKARAEAEAETKAFRQEFGDQYPRRD